MYGCLLVSNLFYIIHSVLLLKSQYTLTSPECATEHRRARERENYLYFVYIEALISAYRKFWNGQQCWLLLATQVKLNFYPWFFWPSPHSAFVPLFLRTKISIDLFGRVLFVLFFGTHCTPLAPLQRRINTNFSILITSLCATYMFFMPKLYQIQCDSMDCKPCKMKCRLFFLLSQPKVSFAPTVGTVAEKEFSNIRFIWFGRHCVFSFFFPFSIIKSQVAN